MRITIYSPSSVRHSKFSTRTIEEGAELPQNAFLTKEEAVAEQERRDAARLKRYNSAKRVADERLALLAAEIEELLVQHRANLFFEYEGDSQGIDDERIVIELDEDGFSFTKEI